MDPIREEEYKGYTIKIVVDECPLNPREEFDNVCTICGEHRRYKIGDGDIELAAEAIRKSRRYLPGWEDETSKTRLKFDLSHWPDVIKAMSACDDIIMLSVFMYEHSGIAISTQPFGDKWDSGQVGIAFITREKALETLGVKRMKEEVRQKAIALIEEEVKTYAAWACNDIFGFQIEDPDGEMIESCYGYYGDDEIDHMIEEAKGMIDYEISKPAFIMGQLP